MPKRTVMIVDDAVTVRMFHRQILEQAGFAAEEAVNGIEALEKALGRRFDLFLVDINMPKMDGYRLVAEMRQNDDLAAVPVIMISTEADAKDRDKAYLVGANYYLVKPVKPEVLAQCALLMGGRP